MSGALRSARLGVVCALRSSVDTYKMRYSAPASHFSTLPDRSLDHHRARITFLQSPSINLTLVCHPFAYPLSTQRRRM